MHLIDLTMKQLSPKENGGLKDRRKPRMHYSGEVVELDILERQVDRLNVVERIVLLLR